jgi:hypothetical protein
MRISHSDHVLVFEEEDIGLVASVPEVENVVPEWSKAH